MRKMTRFLFTLALAFCLCLGGTAFAANADAYDISSSYNASEQTITLMGKTDYDRLVARFAGQGKERIYTIYAENGEFSFTFQQGDLPEGEYVGTMQRLGANANPASFTFVVGEAEKVLERIEMNTLPSKTTYYLRESFSVSGGEIKAIYTDGSQEVIALIPTMCSAVDMNTAGTKTVTVNYGGKITSFTITVRSRPSGGGGGSTITRYTVTFDTQGGGEIDSIRVTKNSTVTKPEKPTKEGYTFDGWFTDKECTEAYDFDTKVTKNFTLYAKWTEDKDEPTDPTDPDEWENPFTDVNEEDWFYDAVQYANENGLFSGMTENTFAPDEAITRGMLVTVLYRAENEPATADSSKFADVAPDAYYTKAVIWAEINGIVKGYSEVEFAPDKLISREEMAAIMNRYADYKGVDTSVSGDLMKFADQAQIADWARENVAWAVGYGLLSGKENNLLDPQGHTTRAETAAILNRFLEKNK